MEKGDHFSTQNIPDIISPDFDTFNYLTMFCSRNLPLSTFGPILALKNVRFMPQYDMKQHGHRTPCRNSSHFIKNLKLLSKILNHFYFADTDREEQSTCYRFSLGLFLYCYVICSI
jgi:hypothetical protein